MKYEESKPSVFYLFIIPSGLKFTVNGHCRDSLVFSMCPCGPAVLVSGGSTLLLSFLVKWFEA